MVSERIPETVEEGKKKEMITKKIDELNIAIKTQQLVFLVGAGVSFEPPSNLLTWPQLECLKVLSTLDPDIVQKVIDVVRPEIFFQVLYNIIDKRALMPLEILNPATLNSEKELVFPNFLHFFLAEMLDKGHIVLTTNFEDLIESAYEKKSLGKKPNVAIFDEDFEKLYKELDSLKSGMLIKIHGSFLTPEGKDCRDSIVVNLQQVQREFPEPKRKVLEKLVEKYNFVVMGYSGRDDYDLYTFLVKPPINRHIWWIRHLREKDPQKWQVVPRSLLRQENKNLGAKLAPLRKPEDWEALNSNSVVLAYSNGVLIKAYTQHFIEQIENTYSPPNEPDSKEKLRQKMQTILEQWKEKINPVEKYHLMSAIFETAGQGFLEIALLYHNKATEINTRLIATRDLLKRGTIHYKLGGTENYLIAKNILEKALKEFIILNSLTDQAETYNQLLLVYNRLEIIEQGIECGERAVVLYFQLSEIDSSKVFELAQSLRGLALICIRMIPDISSIIEIKEKEHCQDILKQATKLCRLSLNLLNKIGNRTGERGIGQTLNVLGIIKLRLEDYIEGEKILDEYLGISGISRFKRESFQGYRNLALCKYHLALKERNPEQKKERLNEGNQNYEDSIGCRGGDPKIPFQQSRDRDEFNIRFNRSRLLIERVEFGDIKFAVKELTMLKNAARNIFSAKGDWHWRANCLSALSESYSKLGQEKEVLGSVKEMLQEYRHAEDEKMERQPFGVQNAIQNLQSARNHLKQITKVKNVEELEQRIIEQLERIRNLSQVVPSIPFKDWSDLIAQIESAFLK